ncbi:MAG TPA: FAD:protein FMN transferase [Ktedonobacterales bacterium]|jgi:FAD:protein FMN transferase|nr:FAD:protein FMN transferase [Ktedonobacterales bacterium]
MTQMKSMKDTRLLMGMPITVEVADESVSKDDLETVFSYLVSVDERFSTYKETSEVSQLNRGELREDEYSDDLRTVLALSEETRRATGGYFSIWCDGVCDPSGLVKGWAVRNAARILDERGFQNYYLDAGGDLQLAGMKDGAPWRVGIRNPFNRAEHVKALSITDRGVATSGTAIRGQHIYNPRHADQPITEIVSMTVIGPDIYEADRFATAAFAMGRMGVAFIEGLDGFEGYMIDAQGIATYTSGFERYVLC